MLTFYVLRFTDEATMSTKLQWISDELNNLRQQGLYNTIRTIGSPQGAWIVVDGKRVLNF